MIDVDEGDNADFNTAIASKMYALDEVCRRHFVELIPTVIMTTTNQRISVDLLRNFSQKTVALFLLFEKPSMETEQTTSCFDACRHAISTVALAGIKSVILASSPYAEKMASPSIIAHRFDLTVLMYQMDEILNPSLYAKPLLCVQSMLGLLSNASMLIQVTTEDETRK